MNLSQTLISLVFLALISCESNKQVEDKLKEKLSIENQSVQIAPKTMTPNYFDYSSTILSQDFTRSSQAYFSSEESLDELTLHIPKGPITQTRVTLQVHSSKKELIYEHVFPATQLIYGYALDEIHSDEQMQAKIIEWANYIVDKGFIDPNQLSKDHFLNQAPEEEFLNYGVFKKVKASKRIILHYILEEENNMYYGYSDEEKTVVQLISCC
jgi:hypothetical protein